MPEDNNQAPNGAQDRRDAIVAPFFYRGDDSRPMRVVVRPGQANVEELRGRDALGVERWHSVDMEAEGLPGNPECYPHEWAEMVALAVYEALRHA